jgi:hypothetical protein
MRGAAQPAFLAQRRLLRDDGVEVGDRFGIMLELEVRGAAQAVCLVQRRLCTR